MLLTSVLPAQRDSTCTRPLLSLDVTPTRLSLGRGSKTPGITPAGVSEDFPTHLPRSLYGASKLASELLVQEYREAFGLRAFINRCGVIAGPGQFGKVDQGVFTRAVAANSRLAHVLSSAIGGETTTPVVTRLRASWRNVHLLCSDGLTKHVTDERITERLAAMTSAREVCEQLLQDALDGGGSDNITIIVGRAVPNELSA